MVDRTDALDWIDEIRSAFPMELAEAKKLLAARNDYLASAKREGDLLIQQAEERAKQMLAENELLAKAKRESEEMRRKAPRGGDAAARCGAYQSFLLLPHADYAPSRAVCARLLRNFTRRYPHSPLRVTFFVQPLPPGGTV